MLHNATGSQNRWGANANISAGGSGVVRGRASCLLKGVRNAKALLASPLPRCYSVRCLPMRRLSVVAITAAARSN